MATVGDIIKYKGQEFLIVEDEEVTCLGCSLCRSGSEVCDEFVAETGEDCTNSYRPDSKNVFFVQLYKPNLIKT